MNIHPYVIVHKGIIFLENKIFQRKIIRKMFFFDIQSKTHYLQYFYFEKNKKPDYDYI